MTGEPLNDHAPSHGPLLHLELEPRDMTLPRLIRLEEVFSGLIREVAAAVSESHGRTDAVRWYVSGVSNGSIRFEVRPEPPHPEYVDAVSEGIAGLEAVPERPSFFSDVALQRAKELAESIGDDLPTIRVRNGIARTPLTSQLVANVDKVIGAPLVSYGTVEGRLEALTVHHKRSFSVYEALTGQRIECFFGHRIPVRDVGRAVEQRVAVSGELRYRRSGELISVTAEHFEVFPPDSELPTADDVLGILEE